LSIYKSKCYVTPQIASRQSNLIHVHTWAHFRLAIFI